MGSVLKIHFFIDSKLNSKQHPKYSIKKIFIFLAALGNTPLPHLAEKHPAQKPLAELGVPPPLAEKIC